MGYHRAGFEVVGVDIKPQKHYPFEFHEADAFDYLREHGHEFDVIHASPPCQHFSIVRRNDTAKSKTVDLIEPTRNGLNATGKPWIIENVNLAPLIYPRMLCGSSFGLNVRRHRYFETNFLFLRLPCRHREFPEPLEICGNIGRSPKHRKALTHQDAFDAMDIHWMNYGEVCQAIPPAYTEYIGKQLLKSLARVG